MLNPYRIGGARLAIADAVRDPQAAIAELDCADAAEYHAARHGRTFRRDADTVLAPFAHVVSWSLTFLTVVLAWVFFRADNLTSALNILSTMTDPVNVVLGRGEIGRGVIILIYALLALFAPNTQEIMGYDHERRVVGEKLGTLRLRPLFLYVSGALLAFGILGIQQHSEFIYFRF